MFFRKSLARIIAAMAIVIVLASGMSNSVYAAVDGTTAGMVSGNAQIQRVSKENEAKVNQAYEAIKRSANTKSALDIAYTKELINSLSPTNRIRLFVRMARSYYYANYLDFSNKYFDAYAYLKANPDVAAKASKTDDPILYALEHYLDTGIYEGRSSQTSFDPIVAILVYPDSMLACATTGEMTPVIINEEFTAYTGEDTTEGYTVLWSAPVDDNGVYSDASLSHSLYISKKTDETGTLEKTGADDSGTKSQSSEIKDFRIPLSQEEVVSLFDRIDQYSSSKSDGQKGEAQKSDEQDATLTPTPVPGSNPQDNPGYNPAPVNPTSTPIPSPTPIPLINNKATTIDPYNLYFDSASASTQTGSIPGVGPNNTNAQVTYYGVTYKQVKDSYLTTNKDYTFMIYMCGSDQETDSHYVRVTKQLLSMLKAGNLENINIVVCLGGSPSYCNDYMNNSESGIINDGVGIYYIDGSAITEAYNALTTDTAREKFDEDFETLASNIGSSLIESGVTDIINENTFKKIAQVSSIDMGDASLLAGFINLATTLFPADGYGLAFSDHGGGLNDGVCFSADTSGLDGTSITTEELESALHATSLSKSGQKLGMIYFDACLMGSAEEAYNLKDYYEYMLASEEVTYGETDYATLLKAISDKCRESETGSDVNRDIAEAMFTAYNATSFHRGQGKLTGASTLAIYSSGAMNTSIDDLNNASAYINTALTIPEFTENSIDKEIFEAVRKALLSCYDFDNASDNKATPYSKYIRWKNIVDIGEFVSYLCKNIDTISSKVDSKTGISENDKETIKSKLSEITVKLKKILSDGAVVDNSGYIGHGTLLTDTEGSSVDDTSDAWKALRGEDAKFLGASLYVPIPGTTNYSDYIEAFHYEGSLLKEYIDFINKYEVYLLGDDRLEQKVQLKAELSDSSYDYTKLIRPIVNNDSTINTLPGTTTQYITFKVADSYETAGVEAPAHSFGSPLQDMMEAGYSIDISVVHQEKYDIKNTSSVTTGTLTVNMLCGEAVINPNTASLDNGTVSFEVGSLTEAVKGYALSGEAVSGTELHGDSWQYVLSSEYEKDQEKKMQVLTALAATLNGHYSRECLIINGTAKVADSTSSTGSTEIENVQHVFLIDNSEYVYQGSVVVPNEGAAIGYTSSNVSEISAYHYVLVDTKPGDGVKYERKCLEIDYASYGIGSGYYRVSGAEKAPTITVVSITQKDSEQGYVADNNGYTLSLRMQASDVATSYSDILKLDSEKYAAAPDSGNGLLVVNEEGSGDPALKLADSGLTTDTSTTHANDTDDGTQQYVYSSSGSNLTSDGKATVYDANTTSLAEIVNDFSDESEEISGTSTNMDDENASGEDNSEANIEESTVDNEENIVASESTDTNEESAEEEVTSISYEDTTQQEIDEVDSQMIDDTDTQPISDQNPYVVGGVDVSEYASELVEDDTMYADTAEAVNPSEASADNSDDEGTKVTSQTEEAVVDDGNITEMSVPMEDGSAA